MTPKPALLEDFERWIVGYSDDPVLRPVVISLGGHAVIVVAPLLLAVYRSASVGAAGVLGFLLGVSAWLARVEIRQRGPRALTAAIVGSWVLGIACAFLFEWTQVI